MKELISIVDRGIKLSNEHRVKRIATHLQLVKLGHLFNRAITLIHQNYINIPCSKVIYKINDDWGKEKENAPKHPIFYNATNEFQVSGNITDYVVYDDEIKRYRSASIQDYQQLFKDMKEGLIDYE